MSESEARTTLARALAASRVERIGARVGVCSACGSAVTLQVDEEAEPGAQPLKAACECGRVSIPSSFFTLAARLRA